MKRICSLCLTEQSYYKVKKWKTHPLQLCYKCQDALITIAEESTTLQRRAFSRTFKEESVKDSGEGRKIPKRYPHRYARQL